ncbi:vesicle transport v-SNARE 11 [Diplonema papillatum]|nr:vesicle transport v-SNARE 11 [Diplonema papillatum]
MTTVSVEWDEYNDVLRDAEDAVEKFKLEAHGVRHKEGHEGAKVAVKEASDSLKRVETALGDLRTSDEKTAWRKKAAAARKQLRDLSREVAQLDRLDAKKDKLFSGMKNHLGEHELEETSDRARALRTSRSLDQQNQSLLRSEQVAVDTERLGHQTINSLRSQRETMHHIIDTTGEINEEVSRSRALVSSMKRTFAYNRLTQALIILVLLIAISLTVYIRWIR